VADQEPVTDDQGRMPDWAARLLSVGVRDGDSHETIRTKRLLSGVLLASIPTSILSTFQLVYVFGAPAAGLTIAMMIPTALISLFVMWRWPSSFPSITHLPVFAGIMVSAVLVVLAGGFLESGANSVWGFVPVLGALAVFSDRRATFWLWFFIASQVVTVAWATQVEPVFVVENAEYVAVFNLVIVSVFVYFMMLYYVRQRALLLERSDGLLRNILPDEIAARLKDSPDAIADVYESASVLFADVVGFTPMSTDLAPSDLVDLLDEIFSAVDDLVETRGLEKIKTIGDAYMVAAGVPEPRDDHAMVLCDLALGVQELAASQEFRGHRIAFRIGVNSGPVVAGIIGTKKFSYDLWGDTVNTASRMESTGAPGEIQITRATRELVDGAFVCESKGVLDVKGKGPMPVWRLTGRNPAA